MQSKKQPHPTKSVPANIKQTRKPKTEITFTLPLFENIH